MLVNIPLISEPHEQSQKQTESEYRRPLFPDPLPLRGRFCVGYKSQPLAEDEEIPERREITVKGENVLKAQPQRGKQHSEKNKIAQQNCGNRFFLRSLGEPFAHERLHRVGVRTQTREVFLIRSRAQKADAPVQEPECGDDKPFHYNYLISCQQAVSSLAA